jgi:hypothetical protein
MSATDPVKELEMKLQQRIVITALLCAGLATAALSDAQTRRPSGARMTQATSEPSGVHDFDFFVGHWRVHHRRLKDRLSNSHEWIEFDGMAVAQALMGGYGNIDGPWNSCAFSDDTHAWPLLCHGARGHRTSGNGYGVSTGKRPRWRSITRSHWRPLNQIAVLRKDTYLQKVMGTLFNMDKMVGR